MAKSSQELSAREFVWENRLRQRVALERIVAEVGNDRERTRAKQFLEAMETANPELLEDIEQYILDFFGGGEQETLELFDESEYVAATGRKTALKLPQDVLWEEKVVRRAVREYRDLFHPCEKAFGNAMQGLHYLNRLHPELFARVREQAVAQRDQILTFEIYCRCDCAGEEERQPATTFRFAEHGRFRAVSARIACGRQALAVVDGGAQGDWPFFLARVAEVAPEMLD